MEPLPNPTIPGASALAYRSAALADIDLLITLMGEYYTYDHLVFDAVAARATLAEFLQQSVYGRAWIIELDQQPIGYAVLTFSFALEYHGRDALVDELYLREAYRGQGIGSRTLEFLEATCRELGIRVLHLVVERKNARAQAVYRKAGFTTADRDLMSKPILESPAPLPQSL